CRGGARQARGSDQDAPAQSPGAPGLLDLPGARFLMPAPDDYHDMERRFTPELVDAILEGDTPSSDPAAARLASILAELRAEVLEDPSEEVSHRHLNEMLSATETTPELEVGASRDTLVAFERKGAVA